MNAPTHVEVLSKASGALDNPGLTVGLALVSGIIATSLARHLRLPGIVLLLFGGVVLGPDGAGLVRPHTLGPALQTLVGFAVAIILFEGGMSLNFKRLRTEGRAIRQLISIGALVTMAGATLAARAFLLWPWRMCILFGTLVIVTGPTVIQPLLRRLKVERSVATVLEAEGVLIDAVGAIIAAVALEVALSPSGVMAAKGLGLVFLRLGFGVAFGLLTGYAMALLLRVRGLVPQGLENVFVLCLVVALFQTANGLLQESGIATVTVAGMVVGNSKNHVRRELQEFKEQLTVMFIGMLFILLAADVRMSEIRQLGTPALWVVAALMFVVRPLNVWAGTWRTQLGWRQKVFMGWIGPRGIVAAAVAAFFVSDLEAHGVPGAKPLQALVFLVIGVTVLSAGLTGGIVARLLKLRRPSEDGWIIMGAGDIARSVAGELKRSGEDVVLIDTAQDEITQAQKAGLRVVFGDALDEGVLARAGVDSRAGALALTSNDEMNGLFLQVVHREAKLKRLYATLRQADKKKRLLEPLGGQLMFGTASDIDNWSARIRKNDATLLRFVRTSVPDGSEAFTPPPQALPGPGEKLVERNDKGKAEEPDRLFAAPQGLLLIIARRRDNRVEPVTDKTRFRRNDQLLVLVKADRLEEARAHMARFGMEPLPSAPGTTSGEQPAAADAGKAQASAS